MNLIQDEQKRMDIISRIRDRSFSDRTGIHYSDLNYCLRKPFYRTIYPEQASDESEQTTLLFSIGHAWEHWLTRKDDHEEYQLDGIKMTPDFSAAEGEYWEIKASYLSSKKDLSEQTQYIRQMMAYSKVLGVTEFFLVAIHLMGDWSFVWKRKDRSIDDRKPVMNVWRCQFTQQEINDNWNEALFKKELLVKATEARKPPPPMQASWECGFCRWGNSGICGIPKGVR